MVRFSDLSTIEQTILKEKVFEWFKEGKGYKKIKKILASDNVAVSQSNLSYWKNNQSSKLRKNSFELKPSKELSYIVGVMFGDGCASDDKANYDYPISLAAIDKEFVEKFSFCLSKITGRTIIAPVHLTHPNMYSTHVRCKELSEFLHLVKKDFDRAKPFIEGYPAEFIQGLADSEGGPSIAAKVKFRLGVNIAYSTNLELLKFTQILLQNNFNICSRIYLVGKIGQQDSILEGRLITRTKNVYNLKVNGFLYSRIFLKEIGFNIIRKREKLSDAIEIMDTFLINERIDEWKRRYVKQVNKRWKRISSDRLVRDSNPGLTRDRGES